jgi:hypothetical protein
MSAPIVHISGHVWTHRDNIAKIEGFEQTLLIKVTLKDGTVYERYVSEQNLAYWTDAEKVKARHDELVQKLAIQLGKTPKEIQKFRDETGFQPPVAKTRKEAFERILSDWIRDINSA